MKQVGLDQLNFFPANVSSEAFNRSTPCDDKHRTQIQPNREELPELEKMIGKVILEFEDDFRPKNRGIAFQTSGDRNSLF